MAARRETLRVKGYREFMRAAAKAPKDTRQELRAAFHEVGEIVREDAAQRLQALSPKTAAGLRTRVRQKGVAVQQSLRKTTGKRSDWGGPQGRRLRDALAAKERESAKAVEHAMERMTDRFGR